MLHTNHISSGDWWNTCMRCGLEEQRRFIWDDDGQRIPHNRGVFTRIEGHGAVGFRRPGESWGEVDTLAEDFVPEMLNEQFDIPALEREYDRAQSYIAYFNPSTGAVSVLWGDREPPMFVEGVDDEEDY